MKTIWGREPAAIAAAIAALINVAVIFGVDWTADQVATLNIAVVAVVGLIVRQSVTPTGTG